MEATKILIFNNYTIMKKLFITLFLAVMAIGANAQVTWNVRAGVALANVDVKTYGSLRGSDMGVTPALAIGCNIPIGESKFTFSPTIISLLAGKADYYYSDYEVKFTTINLPLYIGYKMKLSGNRYFVPKIGPYIGYLHTNEDYDHYSNDGVRFGPSAELAFELNHFIVALSGSMAIYETCSGQGCLTIGYKF